MKKILLFVFIVSVILYGQNSPGYAGSSVENSQNESWYTYWGIGLPVISYPSELQNIIDLLGELDDISNTSFNMDMFGLYLHLQPNTIAGFIANFNGDRYLLGEEYIQINQYLYSLSVIHYLSDSFGSGFFFRGEGGVAVLSLTSSFGEEITSENGFGVLVGGGWSFDFGGTSLLLNVNYAHRIVEEESYDAIGFSIGGLF
ncbi:MAG: hypothetical protein KAS62_12320 [Candidatus Delongbacteria bacterium]|nr:hypothetical protein [Candidatus Delongbacteria bacterium]